MTTVFLDAETTGLHRKSDPWEVAAIVRGHSNQYNGEWVWQIRPDLAKAEPMGLRIGRFYERFLLDSMNPDNPEYQADAAIIQAPDAWQIKQPRIVRPSVVARQLCLMLDGAAWVGAVPSFDELRLGRFIRRNGHCLTNHYHLVDVEALAIGYLRGGIDARHDSGQDASVDHGGFDPSAWPWKSRELMSAIGVQQDPNVEHTALGDARWAEAAYDRIMGEQ